MCATETKSKICPKCGIEKEEKAFFQHRKQCKKCYRTHKKNYLSNPNVIKHRNDLQLISLKNPFYKLKRKIEFDAKTITKKLIKEGKILPVKEQKCSFCGKTNEEIKIHMHHCDYNLLNQVIPLCCSCHKKLHQTAVVVYPKGYFDGVEIPEKYKNKMSFETLEEFLN